MPEFHHSQVKLGKKEARHDPRDIKFGDYLLAGALPDIPPARHWGSGISRFMMFGNDAIGDCTIAGAAHMQEVWTFNESGTELILPESDIITAYSSVSGYVPGDPTTDTGANLSDVLNYWVKTGIGGNKIKAYSALEPGNHGHVMASIDLFGGCYMGVQLPITVQSQSKPNSIWSLVPGYKTNPDARPNSWGGHLIAAHGFNSQAVCVCSWGSTYYLTWQWIDEYADELFSIISPQWLGANNIDPLKFNLSQLESDLKLVT